MKNIANKLFKKTDLILIAFVLALACAVFVFLPKGKGNTAIIRVDGEIYREINLEKTLDEKINVHSVVIEVKNGKIGFVESSCKDKICVKCGFLEKKGESALCSPNGVSIEIVDEKVDARVY